jgi:hypothetical protein
MKNLLVTILALILMVPSYAQIATGDLKYIKNAPAFKNGEKEMLELISKNLNYPVDKSTDPDAVTVLGFIKLSNEGKIEEIGTINKVSKSFKNEFVKFARKTDGMWAVANGAEKSIAIIPVTFNYDGVNYSPDLSNNPEFFQPALSVNFPSEIGIYDEDQVYLEKVHKLAQNEKYEKAIEVMETLLTHEPAKKEYYLKMIELTEKANQTEDSNYYKEVVKIFNGDVLAKNKDS